MFDALIVGQGIAGSCLAYQLMSRGLKICIIDEDFKWAACRVAAGVLNPITGKRLVKSWRSDVALPFAKDFYTKVQKEFGETFFFDRQILQMCKSQEEIELWHKRTEDELYSPFLSAWQAPETQQNLNDNFGSFIINFAAWVEAPHAMDCFRKYFLERGVLRLEYFDYSKMQIEKDFVKYGEISAKKVVFCEGWRAVDNPYFNWLPYRPARGEILTIKSEVDFGDHIIHREKWLMKRSGNLYRCGSTWDRENFRLDSTTTDGSAELAKALPSIIKNAPFEIIDHENGVRPCTATTRPHLGKHPTFENLYSFNGFGSKGYVLSPYFASHFADYLQGKCELDKEADLARHIRKFFNK